MPKGKTGGGGGKKKPAPYMSKTEKGTVGVSAPKGKKFVKAVVAEGKRRKKGKA